MWSLAGGANQTNETLRQHTVERRHEVIGIDAHIQKTSDYVDDVVGMYGGEDEVPRQRRLNGYLGCLGVADFADHDFIRVVAQDGAQAPRKRQALFFVDRNLRDAL